MRQRSVSCPDITKDQAVIIEDNLLVTQITSQRPETVGKLEKRIFSNAIKNHCTETSSEDVIFWTLEYLEQLFVLLAQTNDDNVREQKTQSSKLLYTISEESVHSVNVSVDEGLYTSNPNQSSKTPQNDEKLLEYSNENCNLESEMRLKGSDSDEIQLENNLSTIVEENDVVEESEPRLKVENIVLNMYERIKVNIPEAVLKETMEKIHPLFIDLKEIITLELSTNYSRLSTSSSKVSSVPAVSGPPPPAPPPPPPPKVHVLNFKVKTMGRTLSEAESSVNDGTEDIELRINKKPKKDDMMAQLQMKLQARQRRESLQVKLASLK